MEEVKELKEVLERVDGKLITAGKMYGAMNYAVWLVVMVGYYILAEAVRYEPVKSALYWALGAETGA